MPRLMAISGAGVLMIGLSPLSGWDYLQLDRTVPPMAAATARATGIVVDRAARKLTLMRDGDVRKAYDVALGRAPIGPKQQEADGRTPEGRYVIDSKNPGSHSHFAPHVSCPDATDRARALRRGAPLGGDIMIHGLRNASAGSEASIAIDWTDGCIAVTHSRSKNLVSRRRGHAKLRSSHNGGDSGVLVVENRT